LDDISAVQLIIGASKILGFPLAGHQL